MKTNSRMGDVFRVSTEVFLITTVVGLAKVSDGKRQSETTPSRITERLDLPRNAQPGSGGAAVVALDSSVGLVDYNGNSISLPQFLNSGVAPERIILRLK